MLQGVHQWEQRLRHFRADHRKVARPLAVGVGEVSAALDHQRRRVAQPRLGPEHRRGDAAGAQPNAVAHPLERHHAFDGLDGLFESADIFAGQAVFAEPGRFVLPRDVRTRRLDRADDDIARPEAHDVLHRCAFGALAVGRDGDHRPDADDDAQRRQQRPQLMHPQVGQPQTQRGEEKIHVGIISQSCSR